MRKRIFKILLLAATVTLAVCLASCGHTHDYGSWGEDSATCTKGGTHSRTCKKCGSVQTSKTGAKGHDMQHMEDCDPTCTEPGYSYNCLQCTRCGIYGGVITDALGHNIIKYENSEATCSEDGYVDYEECTECDYYSGTRILALGHDMSAWFGDSATCTLGGREFSECSKCDYFIHRNTLAKGHVLEDGQCSVCGQSDVLVLIENGQANFTVVHTSYSGSTGKILADTIVDRLRSLGITIADAVSDVDGATATDYEIIIGAEARGRGEECCITEHHLGREGEVIKRVGDSVVIAGSTNSILRSVFNKFMSEYLGITDDTEKLEYAAIDGYIDYENITKYPIDNILINSTSITGYTLVLDYKTQMQGYDTSYIDSFADNLYAVSGYRLKTTDASNMSSSGKYIVIRFLEHAGDEGFRAYVADNGSLIIECAYKNRFNDAFHEFANEYFYTATGDIVFSSSFKCEKTVNKVYYEEFGANGDDEECDFEAIYNAHVFANACGQKVIGKAGAVYHISPDNFIKTIPINTDVDFCGATFIVDDVGEAAYTYRSLTLFTLEKENAYRSVPMETMQKLAGKSIIDIPRGTTSISWLKSELQSKSMLQIISTHRDYIRHGANENGGTQRTDMVIINTDGTLEADTPIVFDFESVSVLRIYRVDDKALTVENGIFKNICCTVVESTTYDMPATVDGNPTTIKTTHANKYHSYKRGFGIYRSNVTLKNIDHEMLDEPVFGSYPEGCGYVPDSKHVSHGSRHESYPYYGFIFVDKVYNLNVKDSSLDGHTTYNEDKPATVSTGNVVPNPVPMGSYDFVLEYSCNVTFTNVVQKAETGLGDSRYWGIMSSNGSRNLTFDGCQINRFDAHKGFWNATLRNTTIGHSFNVIGGGTLIADGVTKITGTAFISLRSDYGATFRGDMILKNCTFENRPSYNTNKGGSFKNTRNNYAYLINSGFNTSNSGWSDSNTAGAYWLWDFGYTCYMPENITLENFTSYANKKTYLFNDLPDVIFEKTYVDGQTPTKTTVKNAYQITKSITYVGMTPFEVCAGTTKAASGMGTYTYNKLKSIPTTTLEKADVEE